MRTITIVFECEDIVPAWIYEAHTKPSVNGIHVKSICEGDIVKERDDAYEEIEQRDRDEL